MLLRKLVWKPCGYQHRDWFQFNDWELNWKFFPRSFAEQTRMVFLDSLSEAYTHRSRWTSIRAWMQSNLAEYIVHASESVEWKQEDAQIIYMDGVFDYFLYFFRSIISFAMSSFKRKLDIRGFLWYLCHAKFINSFWKISINIIGVSNLSQEIHHEFSFLLETFWRTDIEHNFDFVLFMLLKCAFIFVHVFFLATVLLPKGSV